MPLCSVPSCKNRSDSRGWKTPGSNNTRSKVTFHRFPKSDTVCKLWMDISDINSQVPTGARVCSMHFSDESFDRSSPSSTRLRASALPQKIPGAFPCIGTATMECSSEQDSIPQMIHTVHETTSLVRHTLIDRATSPIRELSTLQPSISREDKATMISAEFTYNSPEKNRLRQRIEALKGQYSKKIRGLQQNLRRSNDRIVTLKSTLDSLKQKNLLNDEEADVLQSLGGSNGEVFNRLIRKQTNQTMPREYDPEIRSFALTLHYYSPRAYDYVRSKLDCCLPHPKTISKWYGSIEGNPGISTEALNSIKARVANTEYQLIGALMYDEMAIRQHLEYDGVKFSGYTDMGEHIIDDDDTILASEALVFMIVCVNSAWKIPIAYYLIHGISAEKKRNLALQCISALHDVGLKVISLTCDGTSTNFAVLKRLGCNYDIIDSLQTSFAHPVTGDQIMTFPDPCHMIKLVRNAFGDLQSMIDAQNRPILWSYLTRLHDLQEKEQMHLGNKLRCAHIHYNKQKMKVRLATQLFSRSVADSLLFCKNTLMLEEFKFCEGTIQFLLLFNDLFDILNSKNIRQPGVKKALTEQNFELVKSKLNETKAYILCLKAHNGELLIRSRRKTGFLGFLICIESTFKSYEELHVKIKLLKYIPFYKISQDHIELLFGCIRQQGGGNNNPTVRQFKAAIKKF